LDPDVINEPPWRFSGFDDQAPNSDTMLDLDADAYDDILKSFDTNGL